MATIWMTVFEAADSVALQDPLQEANTTVSGTSATLTAITDTGGSRRRIVRIFSDTNCHITWGNNPTATTSNIPIQAGQTEYFHIKEGYSIAVIERV